MTKMSTMAEMKVKYKVFNDKFASLWPMLSIFWGLPSFISHTHEFINQRFVPRAEHVNFLETSEH